MEFSLDQMDKDIIIQQLNLFCEEGRAVLIQVVLTDGHTLVGAIESYLKHGNSYLVDGACLRLIIPNEHDDLVVPLSRIAAIRGVSWLAEHADEGEDLSQVAELRRYEEPGTDAGTKWSYEVAESAGIERLHAKEFHPIGVRRPIVWGRIAFASFEPMYCDWDYLSRMSGGIRSLGLSTPIGGLSVGAEPSLWDAFVRQIRSTAFIDFDEIHTSSTGNFEPSEQPQGLSMFLEKAGIKEAGQNKGLCAVRGNVTFFQERVFHEMEGGQWELGVFTKEWQDNRTKLEGVAWVPIYFLRKGFMYPRDLWERVMSPFTILCSCHGIKLNAFGAERHLFLKARLAAFLPEESESNKTP
jgi:hypothetical protein